LKTLYKVLEDNEEEPNVEKSVVVRGIIIQITNLNNSLDKLIHEPEESSNESDVEEIKQSIKDAAKKAIALKNDDSVDPSVVGAEDNVTVASELLESKKFDRLEALKDKGLFEVASTLLKDGGIKTRIIKQYIPIINKLVNNYLSTLDFFVNFELDEEFNEIIKSRDRDEFSYYSFSEGEKSRIDISLILTWREIAKIKNSTNTNLLILDEKTNIFIISHKDLVTDKFRNQIAFEKVKGFSRIAK